MVVAAAALTLYLALFAGLALTSHGGGSDKRSGCDAASEDGGPPCLPPTPVELAGPVPLITREPFPTAASTQSSQAPINTPEPTEKGGFDVTPTSTATMTTTPLPTETAEPTEVPEELPTDTPVPLLQAVPTSTATETPTEEPTATPTPRPTSTPTPRPTATPTPPPTEVPTNQDDPELFSQVEGIQDVATDPQTVATNAMFAMLTMLVVLLGTTVFNETVKENSGTIHAYIGGFFSPFEGVARAMASLFSRPGDSVLSSIMKPLGLLAVNSVIYALLEPNFGLNPHSLVLICSLAVAMLVITYVYEGGQVLASKRFDLAATLQFYPIPIVIAMLSVVVSRLLHLNPGIIVGFIAAARVLGEEDPARQGRVAVYPMVALILLSLAAWLSISPLRSLSDSHHGVWAAGLEASAIAVFVGGTEGLLFLLLPFEFMTGHKIWQHSRLTWFALSLPVTFIFFHLVVHEKLSEGEGAGPLILLLASLFLVFSVVLWVYFYLRRHRMHSQH